MGAGHNGEQFRQLLTQADRLWDIGRIQEAIKLLHRVEALEPENARVQACLGHLYDQSKNPARALKHLERAIGLDPEDGYAHRVRACVLCEAGRLDEALKAAETAVRYETESADSSMILVQVLARRGSLGRAKQVAARMRSRWPASAMTHWCLGFIAAQEFRWNDSERHYRRTLELEPDDSRTLNSLGVALQAQGKLEEARQMYLRAVGVDPTNAVAQRNVGRTFHVKPDDPAYAGLPRELKEEYAARRERSQRLSLYFCLSPLAAALLYVLLYLLHLASSIPMSFSPATLVTFAWAVWAATALAVFGRFSYPPNSAWQFNCGVSAAALSSWCFMWARDASFAPSPFNGVAAFLSLSLVLLLSSYRLVSTLPFVLRLQERREGGRGAEGRAEG